MSILPRKADDEASAQICFAGNGRVGRVVWLTLLTVGVVLTLRRWAGAFTIEPPVAGLLLGALLTTGLSVFGWCSLQSAIQQTQQASDEATARRQALAWASVTTLLAVLPLLAVIDMSHIPSVTIVVSAGLLVCFGVLGLHEKTTPSAIHTQPDHQQRRAASIDTADIRTEVMEPRDATPAAEVIGERHVDPDVQQWMTRRLSTDNDATWVCVEGVTTLALVPGQQRGTIHIPVHPALPDIPEVECEWLAEVPGDVRVATVQPFGFRLEVRLSSSPADTSSHDNSPRVTQPMSDLETDAVLVRVGYLAAARVPQTSQKAA